MVRQIVHRRKFPIRSDGTRRRGTYKVGNKKVRPLMKKPRVFVSHHSKDEYAKRLLQAQAKNKNMDMQFSDKSINKPFNNKWKTRTKPRIKNSSTTVVMVGSQTHKRKAVQWEIEQSRKAGNKIVAVRIHKNKKHKMPRGIKKREETKWNVKKIAKKLRSRK